MPISRRLLQVDGPARFKRVSGSSIGGGTYWGLCRLLTQAGSYDESLHMASKGESDKVDMLVGDIYGRGYSKFQLSSNTLASSFGKIGGMSAPRGPDSGVGEEDLARALLVMITMNIGQVGFPSPCASCLKCFGGSGCVFFNVTWGWRNLDWPSINIGALHHDTGCRGARLQAYQGAFNFVSADKRCGKLDSCSTLRVVYWSLLLPSR